MRDLPKYADGYFKEDVTLECQVNSHKAIVHWYHGDEQVDVSNDLYDAPAHMPAV